MKICLKNRKFVEDRAKVSDTSREDPKHVCITPGATKALFSSYMAVGY